MRCCSCSCSRVCPGRNERRRACLGIGPRRFFSILLILGSASETPASPCRWRFYVLPNLSRDLEMDSSYALRKTSLRHQEERAPKLPDPATPPKASPAPKEIRNQPSCRLEPRAFLFAIDTCGWVVTRPTMFIRLVGPKRSAAKKHWSE